MSHSLAELNKVLPDMFHLIHTPLSHSIVSVLSPFSSQSLSLITKAEILVCIYLFTKYLLRNYMPE